MTLTKAERIRRHKEFLRDNLELLAAFAWGHYLTEGRGAVYVVEEDFVHAEVSQHAAVRLRYVADASPSLSRIGGWPGKKETNWVKMYNPDEKVVVLILRESGGTSGYLVGGATKPSAAFAREQSNRN